MMQQTIGRYEIRDELGEGGMGTVYLAYDPKLRRDVALKVLQPRLFLQDPDFSLRFEREVTTIASLEHSSIVPLHDFGEDGEWLYFVMRLMNGGTLADRIAQGPFALDVTITILQRIASALDKAHGRGIVHRDVKPGNILFDEEGNAYLSDFGIVKIEDPTGLKTQTGQALGTPQYMSPEQLDGKELDGRSDTYSLGIVLYEMLSGSKPFDHESVAQVMVMHLRDPAPSLVAASPNLPPALDDVIQKSMAKEPQLRYATAGKMVQAAQEATVPEIAPSPSQDNLAAAPPQEQPLASQEPPQEKPLSDEGQKTLPESQAVALETVSSEEVPVTDLPSGSPVPAAPQKVNLDASTKQDKASSTSPPEPSKGAITPLASLRHWSKTRIIVALVPRILGIILWLGGFIVYHNVFSSWFYAMLAFLLMPWTTITIVLVDATMGVHFWPFWIPAILADLATYFGPYIMERVRGTKTRKG